VATHQETFFMNFIKQFRDELQEQGLKNRVGATQVQISFFESNEVVLLPEDLKEYFSVVNGTDGKYNEKWFCFYPLIDFHKLSKNFGDWQGIPNYQDIEKSKEHESCYAFADYQCHLITYAIRLYKNETAKNEVYEIVGSNFKTVAWSFADFMVKYLNDPGELELS
jgi:hypothetical protein